MSELATETVNSGPDNAPETATSENVQLNSETVTDPGQQTQPEPAPKAPWADHLEKFPTSLHPIAEEIFKEWDGNVTKRFQDLHSTYEPYKPFIEEWEPEAIQTALALAQALEADPQLFAQKLAESYGFAESEQGAANQQVEEVPPAYGEDPDNPYAAQLKQQEELLRTLADHVLSKEQAEQEQQRIAQEEQWYEQTMTALKEQYGDFDQDYVNRAMATGVDPEVAVKQFQSLVNSWATRQNAPAANAPQIMGAGGGLPSLQVDPAKLNSRETKNLVAEYLRKANEGG